MRPYVAVHHPERGTLGRRPVSPQHLRSHDHSARPPPRSPIDRMPEPWGLPPNMNQIHSNPNGCRPSVVSGGASRCGPFWARGPTDVIYGPVGARNRSADRFFISTWENGGRIAAGGAEVVTSA